MHTIPDEATRATVQVGNPFFRARIFDAIAASYAEAGLYNQSLEIAERNDNANKNGTLETVSRVNTLKALHLISKTEPLYWSSTVLEGIGRYYISKGEQQLASKTFEDALKAANRITDDSVRTIMLLRIVESQASILGNAKALDTLQFVFERAQEIKDPAPKGSTFSNIAELQAKLGDTAGALHTT